MKLKPLNPGPEEDAEDAEDFDDWDANGDEISGSERRYRNAVNGLCETLDRILSNDKQLTVVTAEDGAIARTHIKSVRSKVELRHNEIEGWSTGKRDRLALTLGLNLHELGHVCFSPAYTKADEYHNNDVVFRMMNMLEDQRQEMLVTLEYPKALDYFRLINGRAIKKMLLSGKPDDLALLLYHGRKHLFSARVNREFAERFEHVYGADARKEAQTLINEFMTLVLPTDMTRAWAIARYLATRYYPDPAVPSLAHDCMPGQVSKTPVRSKIAQEKLINRVKDILQKREEKEAKAEKAEAKAAGEGQPKPGDSGDKPGEAGGGAGGGAGVESDPSEEILKDLDETEAKAEENLAKELDDRQEELRAAGVGAGGETISLPTKVTAEAHALARLFREVNVDLQLTEHRNLRRGRLDVRSLPTRLAQGSSRVFRRRQDDLSHKAAMAVHIAIDTSGSMHGVLEQAMQTGYVIARGAEMAGHATRITTYSNTIQVVKDWQQGYRGGQLQGIGGGTVPLPLLKAAPADFRKVQMIEDIHNHVLFMVTDGAWSEEEQCKEALRNLKRAGVYVIMIGLGMDVDAYGLTNQNRGGHWGPDGRWVGNPFVYDENSYKKICYETLTVNGIAELAPSMREVLRKLAVEIAREIKRKVTI